METERLKLKKIIEEEVFITKDKERIAGPGGVESNWLFDFRRVLLRADVLDSVGELFYERFEREYPFQVGGIEVAAIPLVTALILKLKEKRGRGSGFFIRKSRKKSGLLRMIEGVVTEEKVILVDDIINTGKSFIRQVEVIESLGKKVTAVFVLLRFRDLSYYTYFHERGIQIVSLFELANFENSLRVANLVDKKEDPVPMPFTAQWHWGAEKPDYLKVISKSAPIVDEARIYFGTDNGSFFALNQSDGHTSWVYQTLFNSRKRKAFSSPVLYKDTVYFGASDGNFYALDKKTGKRRWVCMEADWIESTPCVAPDLGLIFVGLEFGLWNKRGGIVALSAETGIKEWQYETSELAYASPAYTKESRMIVSGNGARSISGFGAKTGKLLWSFAAEGDVRGSFALDEKRMLTCFGSFDSCLYVLETKTGRLVHKIKTDEAICSTPLIHGNFVYVTSLDKNVYSIDLETGRIMWKFATQGRIFASPEMVDDKVYVGSNDGRLYELDATTGKNTAFFQATERITDKITYRASTKTIFLPTFANEIYCLKRKSGALG